MKQFVNGIGSFVSRNHDTIPNAFCLAIWGIPACIPNLAGVCSLPVGINSEAIKVVDGTSLSMHSTLEENIDALGKIVMIRHSLLLMMLKPVCHCIHQHLYWKIHLPYDYRHFFYCVFSCPSVTLSFIWVRFWKWDIKIFTLGSSFIFYFFDPVLGLKVFCCPLKNPFLLILIEL